MTDETANQDLFRSGRKLLRKGEFVQAADVLRQHVADNPDDAPGFEALGTACFAAGDNDGALQAFQRAAQLLPREVRVFVNLGAVHNRREEFKDALDVLRKALQKDRKSAEAYYNMGLAHRGLGQAKMAISAYREAIRLAPEMAEAYQNLGNVYLEMDNYPQAVTNYQRALDLRPNFERAARGLQQAEAALTEQRNPDHAISKLASGTSAAKRKVVAADAMVSSDDLQLVQNTATLIQEVSQQLIELLSNNFEDALKTLNRAVADQSDSPMIIDDCLAGFRQVVGEVLPQFQEIDVRVRQMDTLISGDVAR